MVKEEVLVEGKTLSGVPEMPLGFSSLPLVKEEAMVEAAVVVAIAQLSSTDQNPPPCTINNQENICLINFIFFKFPYVFFFF